MAWYTPIKDTIVEEIAAVYKALRPSADSSPRSDLWVHAHTWGHIVKWMHEHLDAMLARIFWTTSADEWLDRNLQFVGAPDGQGGYGLYKAATSSGTSAFKVTCTAGTPTIQLDELIDTVTGLRYRLDEAAPYTFAGPGTYNASIVSVDTGYETNLETGYDDLEFVSAPAGIQDAGEIVSDLDGGRAKETNPEGRRRLLDYAQRPSLSGNWIHWKRTAEAALAGVIDTWIWEGRNNQPYGYACVDICLTQRQEEGADRVATDDQETDVAAALTEELPDAQLKTLRWITANPVPETVVVTYELGAGTPISLQCDWDAEANKRDVSADDSGTKCITASAVYAAGVLASGDRVWIAGKEAVVDLEPGNAAAPVSGNFAKFTVKTWPWTVDLSTGGPAAGPFAICAGGGLISDVWTTIWAYLNGIDGDPPDGRGTLPKLGPAKCAYAAPQSDWDDTIRIHMIKSAASIVGQGYIIDFKTVTVGGAAVDVAPTYDATTSVDYLYPDELEIYQEAL